MHAFLFPLQQKRCKSHMGILFGTFVTTKASREKNLIRPWQSNTAKSFPLLSVVQINVYIHFQRGGPIGAGYPEVEEVSFWEILAVPAAPVTASTLASGAEVGPAAIEEGVSVRAVLNTEVGGDCLPLSAGPNFGVMSPLVPDPLTIPRPGIMGVFREVVDALPLDPKGNLVSKAPESEFDEVLGRLLADDAPKEPQPLP